MFRYALLRLRAQVFVVEQVSCRSASARGGYFVLGFGVNCRAKLLTFDLTAPQASLVTIIVALQACAFNDVDGRDAAALHLMLHRTV